MMDVLGPGPGGRPRIVFGVDEGGGPAGIFEVMLTTPEEAETVRGLLERVRAMEADDGRIRIMKSDLLPTDGWTGEIRLGLGDG